MSQPPNYRYLLGAQGWEHAAWLGNFYPEDLPAEWRLSFYNTEFECVYLPYAFWQPQTDAVFLSWKRDTLPHFRFLLECPNDIREGEIDSAQARLGASLGDKAVLLDSAAPSVIALPANIDLKQFAQTLQNEQAAPVYLISREADLAQLQQVRTLLQVLGY